MVRFILGSFYAFVMWVVCATINQLLCNQFGYGSGLFYFFVPFNEETIRFFSLTQGHPMSWLYTTIVVIQEFISYAVRVENEIGYIPDYFVPVRIVCSIVHFILLGIEYYGWRLYKKHNKIYYIMITYLFAVTLHYLWNIKVSTEFLSYILRM